MWKSEFFVENLFVFLTFHFFILQSFRPLFNILTPLIIIIIKFIYLKIYKKC